MKGVGSTRGGECVYICVRVYKDVYSISRVSKGCRPTDLREGRRDLIKEPTMKEPAISRGGGGVEAENSLTGPTV